MVIQAGRIDLIQVIQVFQMIIKIFQPEAAFECLHRSEPVSTINLRINLEPVFTIYLRIDLELIFTIYLRIDLCLLQLIMFLTCFIEPKLQVILSAMLQVQLWVLLQVLISFIQLYQQQSVYFMFQKTIHLFLFLFIQVQNQFQAASCLETWMELQD